MTGLFDPRETQTRALLNVAPGPPSTAGESFSAAWEDTLASGRATSVNSALYTAYDRYIREVEDRTGRRLQHPNPLGAFQPGAPSPVSGRKPVSLEEHETRLLEEIKGLAKDHPGLPVKTPQDIRAEIAAKRLEARERRASVMRRSTSLGTDIAGFAGEAAAFVTDPPVLMSMFAGAPVASGILRTALIEGAIAGGVEIPLQTVTQLSRERVGEEPSFGEGLQNVVGATAGGAIFGGGARALFGGTRRLIEIASERELPKSARDALDFLIRKQEMEDDNPFVSTPEGMRAHAERYSEAYEGAKRGRASAVPDDAPVRRADSDFPGDRPLSGRELTEDEMLADLGDSVIRMAREAVEERARTERGREAAGRLRAMIGDAEDPRAIREAMKRETPAEPQRLLEFLRRKGGLRPSDELRVVGITGRTRPGLVRRKGMNLEDAAEAAQEAGYIGRAQGEGFVGEDVGRGTPSDDDILAAIRDDFEDRPVFSAFDEDVVSARDRILAEQAEIDEALGALGIRRQDTGLIADALRAARGAPGEEVTGEAAEEAIPIRTGTARVTAEARVEMERLRSGADDAADATLERTLRDDFADRMDETVFVEDQLGEFRPMTVRQIFDEFEEDENLLREFLDCAGLK